MTHIAKPLKSWIDRRKSWISEKIEKEDVAILKSWIKGLISLISRIKGWIFNKIGWIFNKIVNENFYAVISGLTFLCIALYFKEKFQDYVPTKIDIFLRSNIIDPLIDLPLLFDIGLFAIGYFYGKIVWRAEKRHDGCPAEFKNDIFKKEIDSKINCGDPTVIQWVEEINERRVSGYFSKYLKEGSAFENLSNRSGDIVIAVGSAEQFKYAAYKFITGMKKSFHSICIFPPKYWITGDLLFNWANLINKISWNGLDKNGDDQDKLINFIRNINSEYIGIKNAEISLSDQTYTISSPPNYLKLKINNENNEVNLIDTASGENNIIDKFKVKRAKNGELKIYLVSKKEKEQLIKFLKENKKQEYKFDSSTMEFEIEGDVIDITFMACEISKKEGKPYPPYQEDLKITRIIKESVEFAKLGPSTPQKVIDEFDLCIRGDKVYNGFIDQLEFLEGIYMDIRARHEKDNILVSRIFITDIYDSKSDWQNDSEDVVKKFFYEYCKGSTNRIASLKDQEILDRYYGEVMIFDEKDAIIFDANKAGPFSKTKGHIQIISGPIVKELDLLFITKDIKSSFEEPHEVWRYLEKKVDGK